MDDTKNDNNLLKKSVAQNQAESNYDQKYINQLENQIEHLSLTKANTNASLIHENAKRLDTKEKLTLELKVMENDAILYRELVSQQANLQAQIDSAFNSNKLEDPKDMRRSRFSTHSNKK